MISYIFILTWTDLFLISALSLSCYSTTREFNNLIDNILGGPKTKPWCGEVFLCHDCCCRGHDHREYLFQLQFERDRCLPCKAHPQPVLRIRQLCKDTLYILAVICMLAITYTLSASVPYHLLNRSFFPAPMMCLHCVRSPIKILPAMCM